MTAAPCLEVNGITKRFGGLTANEDVSFTVNQGEILSIIGPNGAGKSTLFNCITGFYRPDAGNVLFRGKDITTASAHKICKLGIARTFQIVQVISDMTVLENVMTGTFLRTYDRKKVREKAVEILRFAGLQEKMDFLGTDITIADKKRLEVAMALGTEPTLLMLDEAMAGLIIVEHVMEAVMELSDRVVVINSGKKIVEGSPKDVVRNPEVIQAYLGDRYHA
jgi:branched-chain amino acid transport system ATP-binding protein